LGLKIHNIDNKKAQSLAKGGNHQGYFLDINKPLETPFGDIKKYNFILVLDNINDVGNIGSIVRSAYSLGVDAIIICGIKDLKLQNIIRSSSGALLDLPYLVKHNVLDVAHELSQVGFSLIGADMNGEDIKNFIAPDKKVLFLGSESCGLNKKLKQKLDYSVAIKMKNKFDSLNVSVAAGILINSLS
jgi:23S rRNA (guanosine2251-2'-O)-methyltransferase